MDANIVKTTKKWINNAFVRRFSPLICAGITFFLGWLWYSKLLFGPMWQQAVVRDLRGQSMLLPTILQVCVQALMAYGVQMLLKRLKTSSNPLSGALVGLNLALFFVAPAIGTIHAFSGNPFFFLLWGIDAGYQAVSLIIMGAVLAMLQKKELPQQTPQG